MPFSVSRAGHQPGFQLFQMAQEEQIW